MNKRVAVAIFYDEKGNIAVQERGASSKMGEKYGFFGGRIEKGETPRQALLRELNEELEYCPKKVDFWRKISKEYPSITYVMYIYLSPITAELLGSPVHEGERLVVMRLDYALTVEKSLFGGYGILNGVKEYLSKDVKQE